MTSTLQGRGRGMTVVGWRVGDGIGKAAGSSTQLRRFERPNGRPVVSILMPVFNERRTVLPVIDRVLNVPFEEEFEVIVVDDGSTDGTADLLRRIVWRPRVKVLFHDRNCGKGAAVQTALRSARGRIVVVQDADEELNPFDLTMLLRTFRDDADHVCYGSRFLCNTERFRRLPTYWANRILTALCNVLTGRRLSDMNTCYKMMPTEVARRLHITSHGFSMEPEITIKLARLGIRIIERPVNYHPRTHAEGKKIRFRDFFRYLAAMVRFRFSPTVQRAPAAEIGRMAASPVTV